MGLRALQNYTSSRDFSGTRCCGGIQLPDSVTAFKALISMLLKQAGDV